MPSSALPEHAEEEGREQWRVHEGEDELEHVHDVVKSVGHVCGGDGEPDAHYCGRSTHPKVMFVAGVWLDVGLIDVVGPNGVKGGDIAGHAGHEAGEKRGEAESEHSRRKVV